MSALGAAQSDSENVAPDGTPSRSPGLLQRLREYGRRQLPESSKWRRLLFAVLLSALILRLLAAFGLQFLLDHRWHRDFLIEGDAEGYWLLAQTIVNGETYAVYTPPRYALRMPGFPALLAIPISIAGPSLFAARLFLAVVGTLACWLTYLLGKRLFNEKIGTLAAAIAAFSPTQIVFSVEILCETAFGLFVVWSLLAAHRVYEQLGSPRFSGPRLLLASLWTGIVIAGGVYQRPSWILAAPIAAVLLLLLVRLGRRLWAGIAGAMMVVGMVAALLPWGIRNQAITGHFTLTTFWMGPSLYDGINPEATGDSDMTFYDRDALMKTMDEYQVDQHYRQAAKDFAIHSPGRVAELAFAKAVRYWKPWPNAEQFRSPIALAAVAIATIPVFLLAVIGAIGILRNPSQIPLSLASPGSPVALDYRRPIWSVGILTGPVFYFALLHMIFVGSLRYRLPAEFPLYVLAATGICLLAGQVRGHRK